MRILVTGGAGKLGRAVLQALSGNGGSPAHELVSFDQVPGAELPGVRHLSGDTADLESVVNAATGADVIIHLAAIRRWGIAPNDVTFRTNVVGAFNAHEAAAILGIRRVVSTSSIAVLGWDFRERDFLPDYLPVDERHPVRPQDAYGLSKLAGEQIARAFTDRNAMETIVLRPPWIASPEELAEVRANGGRAAPRFDTFAYADVRDVAQAYRLAVETTLTGHHVAFVAAPDSVSARPLAEALPELLPGLGDLAADLTGTRSFVSSDLARQLLGWVPKYGWREPSGSGNDGPDPALQAGGRQQ